MVSDTAEKCQVCGAVTARSAKRSLRAYFFVSLPFMAIFLMLLLTSAPYLFTIISGVIAVPLFLIGLKSFR
jgi:hypothetical protein